MDNYNTSMRRRNYVRNYRGKTCGCIKGDVLSKEVKWSKHFLRKYNAWAWDEDILKSAQWNNVKQVEIYDLESGDIYRTSLSDFFEYGLGIDFGRGAQLALPISFFSIERPKWD